jgi:hypothetical protein
MSQYVESAVRQFTASAALGQHLRVYSTSSGTVALAGAGDFGVGTTENPATAANEPVGVRLNSAQGTRKCVANAAVTAGDPVYCAAAGKVGSSGSVAYGIALESATNDNDVIEVLVTGNLGSVQHLRTRVTVAQVNAGATLLPAIPGRSYRVCDMALISIGGAAGAVTTVDILGTQAASGVKLLAGAQANLTQNTLIRAGATGGAILAAGASFVANDNNTAITIGKTGDPVTTSTHFDVLISYVVEA